LWAVAHYIDQSTADVTKPSVWQSSNPGLATISRDGILSAASEGAVDVVAPVSGVSGSLRAPPSFISSSPTTSPLRALRR